MKDLIFLAFSALTLLGAGGVAFSRKILYSGFALLATFGGAAGLFVLLSSDFIAITQILIYVGGILILILFAVMLTSKIGEVKATNPTVNDKIGVPLAGGLGIFLISLLTKANWLQKGEESYHSMIVPIGNALLKEYILPFEIISLVLLGALVGAMVLVRGK